MHWLYLIIAIALLFGASKAAGWLVILLLIGSLLLFLAWMHGWVTSRISSGARSEAQIITADELRVLREQAAERKAAGQATPPDPQP